MSQGSGTRPSLPTGQYIIEKISAEFGAILSYDSREHVRPCRAHPAFAPQKGRSHSSVECKGEKEPEGEIAGHPQRGDHEKSGEGTS
jgi:hypothetical protein